MVGEEATGAVYTRHPRCDRLVNGNGAGAALVRRHIRVVRLTMSPLALFALAMSHVVSRALALVQKFAIAIKRRGASERLVIHARGHYQRVVGVSAGCSRYGSSSHATKTRARWSETMGQSRRAVGVCRDQPMTVRPSGESNKAALRANLQ